MNDTIKIEGLRDVLRELVKTVPSEESMMKIFNKVAEPLIADIQANAPVLTGGLRLSIKVYRKRKGMGITIGPKYGSGGGNHAHLIEYGHRKRLPTKETIERKAEDKRLKRLAKNQNRAFTLADGEMVKAQPFIRPAFDKNKKGILNSLTIFLEKQIQDNWNK